VRGVDFEVTAVHASETFELRRAVLRPFEDATSIALEDDDRPGTGTFAALSSSGAVVGAARVAPAPPPFSTAALTIDDGGVRRSASWRLRGMATREDARNLGVGTAVLARVVQHVADHGGGLLWCNARVPAVAFYRRAGFVEHGDTWDEPRIGPHVVMWRIVWGDGAAAY